MAQFSPLLPQAACRDRQCQLSQIPGHTQLGVQSPHSSPSPGPQASGSQPGAPYASTDAPGSGGGPGKRSGWSRTLGTGVCTCACPASGLGTLCLCRYNSLSILPAALGKPVRDVASKVCGGQEHGGSPWSLRYGADLVLFLSF